MTIYQQELMRKLPQFGCTGQYDESNDALAFFYDGFKIGWQNKTGYVYGAALNELTDKMCDTFYAIQEQAKAIREYTDLYETSPRMGIRDVDGVFPSTRSIRMKFPIRATARWNTRKRRISWTAL